MTEHDQADDASLSDAGPDTTHEVHNTISAQAVSGVVIQAGIVHGGIQVPTPQHNSDRSDSQLELSAVTVTKDGPEDGASIVLDLKLRNIGGQPALLHRATIHIHNAAELSLKFVSELPYSGGVGLVAGHLPVSHTYHLALPAPSQAAGKHCDLDLSQVVEPYGTDRFLIRLGIHQFPLAYLIHVDLHYDAHRILTSPSIAIAHPSGYTFLTIDEIRSGLHRFRDAVDEVREAIDWEMITDRGLPPPDWDNNPPASRADLPPKLRSAIGTGEPVSISVMAHGSDPSRGTYVIVTEAFWHPDKSVSQRLREIHDRCARIVNISADADIRQDSLPQIQTQAETILAQLSALNVEFGTQEKTITVDDSDLSGDLVRLLGAVSHTAAGTRRRW